MLCGPRRKKPFTEPLLPGNMRKNVGKRGAPRDVELMEWGSEGPTHPAVRAYSNGRLGFGFSAGGLLFPYFIGVIEELDRLQVMNRQTQMAGASAGALIVAAYKSGLTMEHVLTACLQLCEDCRQHGTRARLRSVLQKFLEGLLPNDAHEKCAGSSCFGVSVFRPLPKSQIITDFPSKADLIQTLLTSCHLPWYLSGEGTCLYRGERAFDGGLTNFLPVPDNVDFAVQVCCFPRGGMGFLGKGVSISPDAFTEWPYTMGDMLPWAFQPATDEIIQELVERGRQDAQCWYRMVGFTEAPPLSLTQPVATAHSTELGEQAPLLSSIPPIVGTAHSANLCEQAPPLSLTQPVATAHSTELGEQAPLLSPIPPMVAALNANLGEQAPGLSLTPSDVVASSSAASVLTASLLSLAEPMVTAYNTDSGEQAPGLSLTTSDVVASSSAASVLIAPLLSLAEPMVNAYNTDSGEQAPGRSLTLSDVVASSSAASALEAPLLSHTEPVVTA